VAEPVDSFGVIRMVAVSKDFAELGIARRVQKPGRVR
jgi:hypothetical protein